MIKVNLGCGEFPLHGFINVDILPLKKVDLICDFNYSLPFKTNSIDLIYAGHIIEHLQIDNAIEFLKEIHRILKPNGEVFIVVPDFEKVYKSVDFIEANRLLYTPKEIKTYKDKGRHCSFWTEQNLLHMVAKTGFREVKPLKISKNECPFLVSEIQWQSGVKAIK